MAPLLDQKIEAVLETVQKPSRYIGGEANQVSKPTATRLVALCYPDAYEIGISNQAPQIPYTQVNSREAFAAERVYCPWPDMADAMRFEGIPLFTLETWRPVREVDLLGITLQAELTYSNVLEVLDLAGIPLHAAERNGSHPIVIAGSPSASAGAAGRGASTVRAPAVGAGAPAVGSGGVRKRRGLLRVLSSVDLVVF